jgi:hypothetical protein
VAEKGIDEDTAFREILVRLTEKYPDVVPERVAAIVDGVRAEMSTAKVRDAAGLRLIRTSAAARVEDAPGRYRSRSGATTTSTPAERRSSRIADETPESVTRV